MHYSREGWRQEFTRMGTFWLYKGEPSPDRPHALLTAGDHSNGFFNGGKITRNPSVHQAAADDLAHFLQVADCDLSSINYVVGPATGAVVLADRIAQAVVALSLPRFPSAEFVWPEVFSAYGEKETVPIPDPEGLGRKCFAETGYFQISRIREDAAGKNFVVVEDTMTTGKTVEKTIDAIEREGGIVLPFVPVICNRLGKSMLGERQIISLISPDIKKWCEADCPYCKAGSKVLRPKTNWAELTGA